MTLHGDLTAPRVPIALATLILFALSAEMATASPIATREQGSTVVLVPSPSAATNPAAAPPASPASATSRPLAFQSGSLEAPALSLAPGRSDEEPPSTGGATLDRARAAGFVTLDEAYRLAAANNERVASARETYLQAEALRKIARSAVLPQISLEDTYYRQNTVNLTGSGSNGVALTSERNQAGIELTQPLFSGFRDRNYLAFAKENIAATKFGIDSSARQLYGDVASAFYAVLRAEAEVRTLEDSVHLETVRLQEIQSRREVGLARKTDVLLAQSQLSNDVSELTRARNDAAVSRQRLGFLTGVPMELPLQDEVTLPDDARASAGAEEAMQAAARGGNAGSSAPPSPSAPSSAAAEDIAAIRGEALGRRVDLQELDRTVEAQRHLVDVARGEYLPTLGLEANYYFNRWNYSTFQQDTDWTVEVMASIPIFDGGRARADVATARSRLRQTMLDRSTAARSIEVEVQAVWSTLQSDLARLRTFEDQVRTAQENFELIQEEYRNGIATNLEVLAAQNQLLSGRIDLERQRYQSKLDWVALELVRGRLPAESVSGSNANMDSTGAAR